MFSINNEWWKIEFVPPYSYHLRRHDGTYTIGVCNDIDKKIYISEELYGQLLKKVICHELTHAAMFSYNVNLTIEQEEILADIIATYGEEIIKMTNTLFDKIKGRH